MKHIYYICCHFTELLLYQSFCSFFRKFLPEVEQHLVLIEHHYFSLVDYEQFLKSFSSVSRLPFCDCAYTNHWRSELMLGAVYGRLARVRAFLKETNKFTFQEDSLCFIYGMTETVLAVRLLIRKIRTDTRHSVICRLGTCYHPSLQCKTNDWISWLLHNVYTLIGASPVSVHFYGWMVTERRYYREKKIIDHHLVFSNKWKKHQDYIEIKYPLADEKQRAVSQRRYVFFFDDGLGWTSLFPEMSRERWIAMMNQILQALTDLYKNQDVVLLLKCHPADKRVVPYDLAGFDVYDEEVAAEMIYTQRREEIQAVYAVASTSARTASLFGIDSYVFYEMFEFPEVLMIRNKRYLLDFSDVVSIRNLDELRLPQPKDHPSPTTSHDLERLAQLFRDLTREGFDV